LSDAIGPILVGDNEQELFLGRELQHRREVSEKTAQLVDSEVSRLITECYNRAKKTLEDNRALLDSLATSLLERETLTREDIEMIVRGEQLPPRTPDVPPAPPVPQQTGAAEPRRASNPKLFGGPEIAPA
jgi:cell division protease FtsH